jgi:hypothetical protein
MTPAIIASNMGFQWRWVRVNKKQPGTNFPISVLTPQRTKDLVPTLRVGTSPVPLRGVLDVNPRKLFSSGSFRSARLKLSCGMANDWKIVSASVRGYARPAERRGI